MASDQGLHCLLTEWSIKIKNEKYHPTTLKLKQKWTGLFDKSGKFHDLVKLIMFRMKKSQFQVLTDLVPLTISLLVGTSVICCILLQPVWIQIRSERSAVAQLVECWTVDRRVANSRLTAEGVTVMCLCARHFILCLIHIYWLYPGNHPDMTIKLLTGMYCIKTNKD